MTRKPTAEQLERYRKLEWEAHTWGQMERLAGVTDRLQFWNGKTEDQARTALREMILARVVSGEL